MFFPAVRTPTALVLEALAVCERCPVIDRCKQVGAREHTGIWGGEVRDAAVMIRHWRGRMGISQREAARRLGVDQSTIVHWEHSKCSPPASVLVALTSSPQRGKQTPALTRAGAVS